MQSRSQSEEAYGVLRAEVLSCRIEPGAKILINDICEHLGFSSGAVREALSRLSAEGLVTAEPQRGFRAAPISLADLVDLTRARAQIEAFCLMEAVERGDVSWEGRVLAAHHKLSRTPMLAKANSHEMNEAWSAVHGEFHAALAEGCGSAWLLKIRRSLYEQSERYRRLSIPLDHGDRDIAAEHLAICNAAINRNKDQVSRLIKEHIQKTADIIQQAFASTSPTSAAG